MKLTLTLQLGSKTSEHQLEVRLPVDGADKGSRVTYILDGQAGEADCARIASGVYSILIGGRSYEAHVTTPPAESGASPARRIVTVGSRDYGIEIHDPRRRRAAASPATAQGPQMVVAPMPGRIVKVLVEKNQKVAHGAGLVVIEAMKMQNELRAPRTGRVEEIYVGEGTGVETGARLVRLV